MPKTRCQWVNLKNPQYREYHDTEWGVPVFDDQKLFEMLILEGAQAGLSWETILKKREGYRNAFFNFDITKCASLSSKYLEAQQKNPEIIRNKLKISSVQKNAQAVQKIQQEFGSFSAYIWGFVDNTSIQNSWKTIGQIPAQTPLSHHISKDMKKRGMSFVGPTIIYAFMQAVGVVNDHTLDCDFRHTQKKER